MRRSSLGSGGRGEMKEKKFEKKLKNQRRVDTNKKKKNALVRKRVLHYDDDRLRVRKDNFEIEYHSTEREIASTVELSSLEKLEAAQSVEIRLSIDTKTIRFYFVFTSY